MTISITGQGQVFGSRLLVLVAAAPPMLPTLVGPATH